MLGGIGERVMLGVEDVGRIVRDVGKELERRGMFLLSPHCTCGASTMKAGN